MSILRVREKFGWIICITLLTILSSRGVKSQSEEGPISDPSDPIAGTIRFANGSTHSGRLEIFDEGEWGTICNDGWTDKEANVLCRGFDLGHGAAMDVPEGSGNIIISKITCKGDEPSIHECNFSTQPHNCTHATDAGARCNEKEDDISNSVANGNTIDNCDFDYGMCGYKIVSKTAYRWIRRIGSTPSTATGPIGDHTQSSSGYYMYTEASSGNRGSITRMQTAYASRWVGSIRFWYHMYGSGMGTLNIILRTNQREMNAWSMSGNQGNSWQYACVDVQSTIYQVTFEGVRGIDFRGDIAVDDIVYSTNICTGMHNTSCTFEDSMCGYQVIRGNGSTSTWTYFSGSSYRAPIYDHTTSKSHGRYLAMSYVYSTEGIKSYIVSQPMVVRQEMKVEFYYYMHGDIPGAIQVSFRDKSMPLNVWTEYDWQDYGDHGTRWNYGCMDLHPEFNRDGNVTQKRLLFTGITGVTSAISLALDDIIISNGSCGVGIEYHVCTFQNPKLCHYKINCTAYYEYTWRTMQGPTPSLRTGPPSDLSRKVDGYYLYAESSYGKIGDAVSIKFPVKNTMGKYLKFYYHMYGQGMGSLNVIYSSKSMNDETAWRISGNQGNVWRFHCQKVNKYIDAVSLVAVRGSTFTSDIAVDNVFLDTKGCPNAVNCDFENGMCNYTVSYDSSSFYFTMIRGNDHTYGPTGHYLRATSPYKTEGMQSTVTSPVIAESRNKSSIQFHYQGSAYSGNFMVNLSHHGVATRANNMQPKMFATNDEGWIMGCMDIPPDERVSVNFISYSGMTRGKIMLDDVIYNEDPCVVGILDAPCTFDEPNVCGYNVSCRDAGPFKWYRGKKTYSSPTGPKTDHSVLGNGYFMYTESSIGNPGDTTYLEFPSFIAPSGHYLRFYYNMYGRDIGTLQVAIITDSGKEMKWYEKGAQGTSWLKGCINLPANKNVTAVFIGVRGNGPLGDMAIDDVAVVPGICYERNITCSFNDESICGYKNESMSINNWRRVKTSTGYAMSIVPQSGRFGLKSPLKNVTDSCVQISYRIDGHCMMDVFTTDDNKLRLSLKTLNHTYLEKAQFYVKQAETAIRFVGSQPYGYYSTCMIHLEHVNLTMGACPVLDCPFYTTQCADQTQCIANSSRCNRIMDCSDKSDEKYCPKSISCDFEDSYICGYNFSHGWYYTDMTKFTNPDLYLNNSVYAMSLNSGMASIFSPEETIMIPSCLQFYYAGGTGSSLEVKANYLNTLNVSKWNIYFSDLTKWTVGQFELSPGKVQLEFIGNSSVLGLAIDNIQLQNGSCKKLYCPKELFRCTSNEKCIPQGSKCNRLQDCVDNSDELNCPTSIACDAEDQFQCGYEYKAGTWTVKRGMDQINPDLDHSLGLYSGSYFVSTFRNLNDSEHILVAPEKTLPYATCLTFHYSFHGNGEFEIFDNGVSRLVIRPHNINDWPMSSIQLQQGRHNITFIHRNGNHFSNLYSNMLELDSINISNGTCGPLECKDGWEKCSQSPICIPKFKLCDRYGDCPNGEDEKNCGNYSTVRLVGGRSVNQGFVEIFHNGKWNITCGTWYLRNAAVVCKQLGYNGTAATSFTGMHLSSYISTQIRYVYCRGYEASISQCSIYPCIPYCRCRTQAAVDCSNTHCPSTHVPCPYVNNTITPATNATNATKCIPKESVCDGERDCPGDTDEKSCPKCKYNEFQCLNYECIPQAKQCDGVKNCKSGSDEYHCLKHANYTVSFMMDGKYYPVCEDNLRDQDVANRLCHYVGKGNASVGSSMYRSDGVLFSYSAAATHTVFPGFTTSKKSCNILTIKCYKLECGTRSPNLYDTMIQNGQEALFGEYPWQAALYYDSTFQCGAVIIDEWHILTAAHCVYKSRTPGRYKLYAGSILALGGTLHSISKVIVNANFSSSYLRNDIAMLVLKSPMKVTDYVRPICLPSKPWVPNTQCFVSGWGRLQDQSKAKTLYEAKVRLLPRKICTKHYKNSDDSTVCANNNQPNQVACYGDSGGPLACRNEQGYWEVVGIVSYGRPGCAGSQSDPQVFADVYSLKKWVYDTMQY